MLASCGAGGDPEGLKGERRVPDPRVAVVPVARTALCFRERRGRRGHDRARGEVRQPVQHSTTRAHQVGPRAVVTLVQARPRPPRLLGVGEPISDLRLAPEARRLLRSAPVMKSERLRLAGTDREPRVARSHSSVSSGTDDDSASTQAPPRAVMPPATTSSSGETRPYSGRGSYTSSRSTDPSTPLTRRSRAPTTPAPSTVSTFVAPDGQRVGQRHRPARGGERGLQHQRVMHVLAARLVRRGTDGSDRPEPGRIVEEAAEHGRAVEAGEAQPVDRSVRDPRAQQSGSRTAARSPRWAVGSRCRLARIACGAR